MAADSDVTLEFPVLVVEESGYPRPYQHREQLAQSTTAGIKNGMWRNAEIVDSSGRRYGIKGVRVIGGIGPFGGYNVFLNRRVRIHHDLEPLPPVDAAYVKERLRASFRDWVGWSSRGDWPEYAERVEKASTIAELIDLLEQ